jgi:hypothetical protein
LDRRSRRGSGLSRGIVLSLCDVEVLKLVGVLSSGHHTQEITELLLSQILLGEVFEVSLGEGKLSIDVELGLVLVDDDFVTKVASFAVDFDAIVEKLLECRKINDFIFQWLPKVNGELANLSCDSLLSFL